MAIYEAQATLERHDTNFTTMLFSPEHLRLGTAYYMLSLAPDLMNDVVGCEEKLLDLCDHFLRQTTSLDASTPERSDSFGLDTAGPVLP